MRSIAMAILTLALIHLTVNAEHVTTNLINFVTGCFLATITLIIFGL